MTVRLVRTIRRAILISTVLVMCKLETAKEQAAVHMELVAAKERLVIWTATVGYTALLIRDTTMVIVQAHVHARTAQTQDVRLIIQIVNTVGVTRITAMMTKTTHVIMAHLRAAAAVGQTSRQPHVTILDMNRSTHVTMTLAEVSTNPIHAQTQAALE